MREKKPLSAKQQLAVIAIAGGKNQGDAATAAGVARSTVERWLKQPEFSAAIRAQSEAAMVAAGRRLVNATGAAVETAVAILEDEEAAASVRLSAARLILDAAAKYHESAEILDRLATVEQLVEAMKKND